MLICFHQEGVPPQNKGFCVEPSYVVERPPPYFNITRVLPQNEPYLML